MWRTAHCAVGETILIRLGDEGVPQSKRQLARVHRLAQEVGRSELQRLELGLRIRRGGEDDDWNVPERFVLSHRFEDLEPSDVRHVQVQEQDVWISLREEIERTSRVGGGQEVLVSLTLEKRLQDQDGRRVVVDHHDGRRFEAAKLSVALGHWGSIT
jgi:hypothetical protein